MKAIIVNCLQDLVNEKFGASHWENILASSGFEKGKRFLAISDVEDAKVFEMLANICKELKITQQQAFDAFGEYWSDVFAPKKYPIYFSGSKNAKEMILSMDKVHVSTTNNIANAKPPRFTYTWENDKTLIMGYSSKRGMIDLLVSLIKGLGKHYNEKLIVSKIDSTKVKVVFS